jgi:hypothetical protein
MNTIGINPEAWLRLHAIDGAHVAARARSSRSTAPRRLALRLRRARSV